MDTVMSLMPEGFADGAPEGVNVRELREHLAEHLQRVAAGAAVVITSRGQPVARLVPYVQAPGVPRPFGFMEGQIAFLDEGEATPDDVLASIAADLDPA